MKKFSLIIICITGFFLLTILPLQAEQSDNYQENLKKWQQMTPEEREKIKEKFQEWKKLPDNEKSELRKNYRRFKSLPPETLISL
ncbi:MAG: DUF3106 domain-containing protein [Nitrospirae bacterium]|nr:DUF3106 domain-containing protein [Nitrospirota bacterium]